LRARSTTTKCSQPMGTGICCGNTPQTHLHVRSRQQHAKAPKGSSKESAVRSRGGSAEVPWGSTEERTLERRDGGLTQIKAGSRSPCFIGCFGLRPFHPECFGCSSPRSVSSLLRAATSGPIFVPSLPAALVRRGTVRLLRRPRRQRSAARIMSISRMNSVGDQRPRLLAEHFSDDQRHNLNVMGAADIHRGKGMSCSKRIRRSTTHPDATVRRERFLRMAQLSRGAHKCADEIDVLGALAVHGERECRM
jgi:hypothetical protein